MNDLTKMNITVSRQNGAGWMNTAAHTRRAAMKPGMKDLRAGFLADARKYVIWAKREFAYAAERGFKLP